jgi:hypothetical protein
MRGVLCNGDTSPAERICAGAGPRSEGYAAKVQEASRVTIPSGTSPDRGAGKLLCQSSGRSPWWKLKNPDASQTDRSEK